MTDNKLPQNWVRVTLEDVSEIHDNLREPVNSAERSKRQGPYPYYGATGQVGWIDDYRQDGEYILLGEDGAPFFDPTKGKAYLVNGKCWVNNHAHVIKGREGLCSNRYLLYGLNQTNYRGYANGTTRLKLTQSAMKQLPINLAPLHEQHRIVAKIEALFSELDKGIENFKTAREQLKIYRQALLKHAFSGKLTEQWRAENQNKLESAEALLQRIQTERQQRYQQQLKEWEQSKSPPAPLLQRGVTGPSTGKENAAAATTPFITTDAVIPPFEKGGLGGISKPKPPKTLPPLTAEELAELPELPSEWLKVKVSYLLAEDLCNGKSVKDRQGGFPVLRLNALIDGKIDLSISKEGDWTEIQAKNYLVKDGDFLVSRGNGSKHLVGRGGIARIQVGRNNFVAFPDTMIRIRLSNSLVYLDYFSFYWDSPVIRNQVEKTARTTAGIYKINQALIEDYVLPLPCLEEQKVISNLLDSSLSNIDQLDQTITTALQQAEALRQSILKKAFSGQLVPQDPSDEPASMLLERIRAEKSGSDKPKSRKTKHA